MRDISFSEGQAARDDDADAVIEGLRQRLEAAEAANCRMREALTEIRMLDPSNHHERRATFENAWDIADKALASTAPCPHEAKLATAWRLCGEAARRLVHFEDDQEDEALVAELQAPGLEVGA